MALTDDHVLSILKQRLPPEGGCLTLEAIAAAARCHTHTVINSTKRLQNAGRLEMSGGRGKAVFYKVVDSETRLD